MKSKKATLKGNESRGKEDVIGTRKVKVKVKVKSILLNGIKGHVETNCSCFPAIKPKRKLLTYR